MIPTRLLFGPAAGGRGYRLLDASAPVTVSGPARERLNALSLVLATWADSGEPDFAACVPLGSGDAPSVILRARHLGSGLGGTIAYANALLVPGGPPYQGAARDGLLETIPAPDGTPGFVDEDCTAVAAPGFEPMAGPWPGLGLAWRDRIVFVAEPIALDLVLWSALASIDPPEQRERILGWSTSLALPHFDAFVPAELFQLVVTRPGPVPQGWPHLVGMVDDTGFSGPAVDPPDSWLAWTALHALAECDTLVQQALAPWTWQPALAAVPSQRMLADVAEYVLRQIGDNGAAAQAFVTALWTAPSLPGANLHAATIEAITAYAPQAPVDVLLGLCAIVPGRQLGPVMARQFALAELSPAQVEMVLKRGYAAGLTCTGQGAVAMVGGLDNDRLASLVQALVEEPDWTAASATVMSVALARAANIVEARVRAKAAAACVKPTPWKG